MPKSGLPPRDSWTFMPKGSMVVDVQEVSKAQNELTTRFHQIRGNLLAAGYNLERILDQLLLISFIPTELHNQGPQAQLFDELFLKGRFLSFFNKIEILKKISSEITFLQKPLKDGLLKKLDETRKIRNLFAHYPIIFHMIGKEPITSLKPVLVTRNEEIEMTNEKIEEYFSLFNSVGQELEDVLRQATGKNQDDTKSA